MIECSRNAAFKNFKVLRYFLVSYASISPLLQYLHTLNLNVLQMYPLCPAVCDLVIRKYTDPELVRYISYSGCLSATLISQDLQFLIVL